MVFPQTPLPVVVELFVDAAWVDITAHVYTRGNITITRGRANEGSQSEPSTLLLEINNRDGRYSPRNPTGVYYGKIGRNTPIRVRITGETDSRFVGEVVAWPQRWDKSEADVWVPIEAAGIMRRLGQGGSTPKSAPRRYIPTTNPTAYWPLEDGTDARQGEAEVGEQPMRSTGSELPVLFGEGDLGDWLLPGAKGSSASTNSRMTGNVVWPAVDADDWAVDLIFRGLDSPAGTILQVLDAGSGVVGDPEYTWTLTTSGEPTPDLELKINDNDGTPVETVLGTSGTLPALIDGRAHHLRLATVQSGTSVNWNVYIDGISVLSGTRTTTTNHGVSRVQITTWGTGGHATAYGHVAVHHIPVGGGSLPSVVQAAAVALGSVGEAAGRRIERLCAEEGITFSSSGDLDESQGMGAQPVDGLLNLLHECEAADMGLLYEPRTVLGLHYCTRAHMYNQATAALTLDYAGRVFASAPTPVDDDQRTRNDVTVNRFGGASRNAVLTSGPMSTQAPPNGVGRYDETVTVNIAGDGNMLENQAGWRLRLGTVDEARYPTLHVNLAASGIATNATLTAAIVDLEICDRLDLTNLPSWIPPDDVSQIVQGFTETFADGGYSRHITINCVPESPYRVAVYESAASATGWKYESGGSTLSSSATTTATSLSVATAGGHPLWTAVDAEDGFDIVVGGERMTVTDISGASSPQTFTVTRSVNGVVKAHSSGAAVALWKEPVYALG